MSEHFMPPGVSIAIPTKNAGPAFAATLAAIRAQEHPVLEIVIADSGSTDDTVTIASAAGARVIVIPPEAFGHGRTRNVLVDACRGELIALLVQDAIPADARWLTHLVEALAAHPEAAGAFSRSLPHEDARWIARQMCRYQDAARGLERSVRRMISPTHFGRMPLEERRRLCAFDNVSGLIRKRTWTSVPFREIAYAEDLAWGLDVLRAGYEIIYEPLSLVRHSHERPPRYWLTRAFVEGRDTGRILEIARQPWYRYLVDGAVHFIQVAHGMTREAARQRALTPHLACEIGLFALTESLGQSLGALLGQGRWGSRVGRAV